MYSKRIRLFVLSAIASFAFFALIISTGAVKAQAQTDDYMPASANTTNVNVMGGGDSGYGSGGMGYNSSFYVTKTVDVNLPYTQLTYTNTIPYYFFPTYTFAGTGGYGGCGIGYGGGGYGGCGGGCGSY